MADKDGSDDELGLVVAEAYDYAAEQAVRVRGPARALAGGDLDALDVEVMAYHPAPSDEELELAFEAVRRDERLGRLMADEGLRLYAPMPPVAHVDLEDGRTERVVTVGLHDELGLTRQFVGVRLRDRVVLVDLPHLPQPTDRICAPSPPSFDCPTRRSSAAATGT